MRLLLFEKLTVLYYMRHYMICVVFITIDSVFMFAYALSYR